MAKTKKITITLDKDILKEVDIVAKNLMRSRSNTISYLLNSALNIPKFLGGPGEEVKNDTPFFTSNYQDYDKTKH